MNEMLQTIDANLLSALFKYFKYSIEKKLDDSSTDNFDLLQLRIAHE